MESINKQGDITTAEMDLSGFRDAQSRLFWAVTESVEAGQREVGVHLHIRGGKTMLMRMLAKCLIDRGTASVAMIINNRAELRRQCADPAAFAEDCRRLAVPVGRKHPARSLVKTMVRQGAVVELDGYFPEDPWANNEYILSTTIQTLTASKDKLLTWLESVGHQHKSPVLVFVDEAQEFGTDEAAGSEGWELIIDALRASNCIIVSLSGFPHRQDGKTIPGFIKKNQETRKSVRKMFGKKIQDIDERTALCEIESREINTEEFDLVPEGGDAFVFPLAYGFDTGALCSIYEDHITRKVTIIEDGEEVVSNQAISDLSEGEARRNLRAYLTHDSVIADAVTKVQEVLFDKRTADPGIKAMIFTCADERGEGGSDSHANRVADFIKTNTALRCVVVTQNSVGDESPADVLMRFKSDDNDVIILKNIGRVGFDCPRAKVLCDLSDIRAQGKTVQTWLRISTPYNGISAVIIHPNDPAACAHYQAAIGRHMDKLKRSKSDVISVEEKEVTFKDRAMEIGDLVDSVMFDNLGAEITSDQARKVSAYKRKFRTQAKYMERETLPTQWRDFVEPYLASGGKLVIEAVDSEPVPSDPAIEAQRIRSVIFNRRGSQQALVDQYMNALYGGRSKSRCIADGVSEEEWRKRRGDAIARSKRAARIDSRTPPQDISSVDAWQTMHEWWVDEIKMLRNRASA